MCQLLAYLLRAARTIDRVGSLFLARGFSAMALARLGLHLRSKIPGSGMATAVGNCLNVVDSLIGVVALFQTAWCSATNNQTNERVFMSTSLVVHSRASKCFHSDDVCVCGIEDSRG